jgi:stearoyl-CoA desaturase (delta-9 desaturase)
MNHWIYGILDLSWWQCVIYTLVLTHITIAAVTLFLHRSQAHRACDLHPIVSHFFRFWLWLTTGMETKAWVAIHRKHHAMCETEEDPHSPQIEGIQVVLWQGAELYRKEGRNDETLERFGHGTPSDWLEKNLYTPFSAKGIFLMLFLNLLFVGLPGIMVWGIQMIWIPFFACGIINGLGHFWGYRNFECPDAATNVFPWGILIGGEELHNNHHTFGSSAKLSVKWWEFDIGWMYLTILKSVGLAKIKKVPPKPRLLPGKTIIDGNTIKAVFLNRFQVIAQYSKHVVMPIFREEQTSAEGAKRDLISKTKTLFVCSDYFVDEKAKHQLEQAMEGTKNLKLVYEFRHSLQQIWQKAMPQNDLIVALQEWCQQAEATGLDVLKDFVEYIKMYTLPEKPAAHA